MGEETGLYEGCGGGVDAGFALRVWVSICGVEGNAFWEGLTWPPEKPTATTLSSLPAERNLGEMVEGEVILRERSIGRREVKEFSKKYLSLRVFKGQINQSSKGGSIESRHSIRRINSTEISKKAEERAKVKYIGKVSKSEEAF